VKELIEFSQAQGLLHDASSKKKKGRVIDPPENAIIAKY